MKATQSLRYNSKFGHIRPLQARHAKERRTISWSPQRLARAVSAASRTRGPRNRTHTEPPTSSPVTPTSHRRRPQIDLPPSRRTSIAAHQFPCSAPRRLRDPPDACVVLAVPASYFIVRCVALQVPLELSVLISSEAATPTSSASAHARTPPALRTRCPNSKNARSRSPKARSAQRSTNAPAAFPPRPHVRANSSSDGSILHRKISNKLT